MPTQTCQRCGKPFEATTARSRFCYGDCFRAHEAEYSRKAWAGWSPERRRAGNLVASAIYTGRLIRQPCEVCGKQPADAHHDDYNQPLNVRWLCRSHHVQHHRAERARQSA